MLQPYWGIQRMLNPIVKAHKQRGSSLVELMIAMLASLVVLVGMITVTVTSLQSSRENLQIMRLDQELRAAMNMMINDIQRAGYWRDAQNDLQQNTNTNPFMAAGTDLSIPNASCILLTYDSNNDGALPAINTGTDDERYGFRLSGGAIQSRTVSAPFSCAAAANTWENLTDTNVVNIASLHFTTVPAAGYQVINMGGTATLTVREVQISMTGNLVGDAAISRTLVESVRVQNDKFAP